VRGGHPPIRFGNSSRVEEDNRRQRDHGQAGHQHVLQLASPSHGHVRDVKQQVRALAVASAVGKADDRDAAPVPAAYPAATVLFPAAELPRRTISFVPADSAGTVLTLAARVPGCVYRHTQSLARPGWPGPSWVVSPAVEGECSPVLDGADDSGGVLDRVRRQVPATATVFGISCDCSASGGPAQHTAAVRGSDPGPPPRRWSRPPVRIWAICSLPVHFPRLSVAQRPD
jgi:hypothetical protein